MKFFGIFLPNQFFLSSGAMVLEPGRPQVKIWKISFWTLPLSFSLYDNEHFYTKIWAALRWSNPNPIAVIILSLTHIR